jgi:hypothetical protein
VSGGGTRESKRVAAILLALSVSACNGPFTFFAGGKLAGESAPVPADWSLVDASGTAQLETLPEDPYSVNLVYTVLNGRLYVNAGDTETRWVKNIEANPAVRLRIDGRLYDLRAERVADRAEIAAFSVAWTGQSMFRRDPAKLDPVWVYRLASR